VARVVAVAVSGSYIDGVSFGEALQRAALTVGLRHGCLAAVVEREIAMGRNTAVSRSSETFAGRYGPWAVVAGASEGVGAAFAESLARHGLNVMLLARRQPVLDALGADIAKRTGVQTRTIAVDLSDANAASQVVEATADLTVGFVVYCAGSETVLRPFLSTPVAAAAAMVQRNCTTPMQLLHHLAPRMVQRGRGGIVVFGSGAGFAGAANMAAYAATKAFDMVFAEALWAELHDRGVDVLGADTRQDGHTRPAPTGTRARGARV
jgi:NADP-dependent 3-hydroxy acid dehydrogenase YdfG